MEFRKVCEITLLYALQSIRICYYSRVRTNQDKAMSNISEEMKYLHESVNNLKNLLDSPEPGIASWNEMLRKAVVKNQSALCSLGATPEACGISIGEVT